MLPKQKSYWDRFPPGRWTVERLSRARLSISDLQFWARLKLQGHFGDGGVNDGSVLPYCRFCGACVPETAWHVLVDNGCQLTANAGAEFRRFWPDANTAHQAGWFVDFVLGAATTEDAAVACVALVAHIGRAGRKRVVL